MPVKKSLKVICIEIGLFLGILAIATHMTLNVWEYFVLRPELGEINSSLHVLKDTLGSISTEYDKVSKELNDMNRRKLPIIIATTKCTNKLDRRTLHDTRIKEIYGS